MYRVEYRTYHGFDNCVWRETRGQAEELAKGLSGLGHVSDVKVTPEEGAKAGPMQIDISREAT